MKKIYALLSLGLLATGAMAQSQRVALFEEFTGENCPPCASTNPGLNNILHAPANEHVKIVAIKYQSPIPSAGPIYNSWKPDTDTRLKYYSVNSAPSGRLDGASFGANQTHPGYFTQTDINKRMAVSSPVTMTLTHTFSPDADSIICTLLVTATQNVGGGKLKARISVIENLITYAKAPGSNGEKEFEDVNRRMLPNADGVAMPDLTAGQTFTTTQRWKLANIADITQVAVVAFVQDDNNKAVHQAVYSKPIALPLDAKLISIKNVNVYQCSNKINPVIELTNLGTTAITSAKITYAVDNGTLNNFNWTGNLASGSSVDVPFAELTLTNGVHKIEYVIAETNGKADNVANNNSKTIYPSIQLASANAPFTEDFQSASATSFPVNNTFINNPNNDETFQLATGAGGYKVASTEKATKIRTGKGTVGSIDEFFLPQLDLSKISGSTAYLVFDAAQAPAGSGPVGDKINVFISTDCGANWTKVSTFNAVDYVKGTATTNDYIPKTTQWSTLETDLSSYKSQASAMVKIQVEAGGNGNFLWMDNINLSQNKAGSASISENKLIRDLNIFPNPAATSANISMNLIAGSDVSVEIYNTLGALVSVQNFGKLNSGSQKVELNLSTIQNGIYSLRIVAGDSVANQKLSVSK